MRDVPRVMMVLLNQETSLESLPILQVLVGPSASLKHMFKSTIE
jgi:hypothetical protein